MIWLPGAIPWNAGTPAPARLFLGHSSTYSVIALPAGSTESGWPSIATLGISSPQDIAVNPARTQVALVGTSSPYLKVLNLSDKSIDTGWPTPAVGALSGVAWSPDGTRLAVFGSTSPYLAVIDVDGSHTGTPKTVETGWDAGLGGPYNTGPNCVCWSPGSDRVATFRGTTYDVWLAASKTREAGWPAPSHASALAGSFSPDGTLLAVLTGSGATRRLHVYTVAGKTLDTSWPPLIGGAATRFGISWSPDGALLLVTNTINADSTTDNCVIIPAATKAIDTAYPTYRSSMSPVSAWAHDGSEFCTGTSLATPSYYRTTVATKTAASANTGTTTQSAAYA